MPDPPKVTAHLYVIWVWEEARPHGRASPRRAMVQDARSGERWGFADVEAMLRFLRARVAEEKGGERET